MRVMTAMEIAFTKASACGNDFLIVDTVQREDSQQSPLKLGDLGVLTRRMCDRHNGVGADGVEWLFADREADVMARLFNADGSEAEISGNGTRCVAAELCSRNSRAEVVVRTVAGLKTCRLTKQEGSRFEFETDMGKPIVGEQLTVEAAGIRTAGIRISMGNPHFVAFVDEFPGDWQQQAARIGAQPVFTEGTNVEYVVVRNHAHPGSAPGGSAIEIRLFERGVGETQSSGTGSCASAVAAIAGGRVSSPVNVVAPGGTQTVRWQEHVFLLGPATLICHGVFFV
jgi:diaminopimelate epimerase